MRGCAGNVTKLSIDDLIQRPLEAQTNDGIAALLHDLSTFVYIKMPGK